MNNDVSKENNTLKVDIKKKIEWPIVIYKLGFMNIDSWKRPNQYSNIK